MQVLCLKGICAALSESDFSAIAGLDHLQELVLDCEQPPELENGAEEIKWGLQDFPEGMLHLTNMTHLTLTCHYGITELPETLSKLSKLEVSTFFHLQNLLEISASGTLHHEKQAGFSILSCIPLCTSRSLFTAPIAPFCIR